MLKILPLLFLAQTALEPATPACTQYVLWKGGDDGLTNRVFAEIHAFNKGRQSCMKGLECRKLYLLIPTNVTPIEGDYKAKFDVEIYRDLSDRKTPIQKFSVECDLTKVNCGNMVFNNIK